MLCQMTGSSSLQNTTNSRFLCLVYQIRIDCWSLLLCAWKHGNNSWSAELLHRNGSVWNTIPKTLHLWRHLVQNTVVKQRPFCIRQLHIFQHSANRVNLCSAAITARFKCEVMLACGYLQKEAAQLIEPNQLSSHLLKVTTSEHHFTFEFWSTSVDHFAIGSDLAVRWSPWLPLSAWVPTFSGWYFAEMVSTVSTTQRQLSLMSAVFGYNKEPVQAAAKTSVRRGCRLCWFLRRQVERPPGMQQPNI